MNRKCVVALTLMVILAISLQSVIGLANAKKPDNPGKPPQPEPHDAWFNIRIGEMGDDVILLEETHTCSGNDYFHVVDPIEDYDYDTYATTDPSDTRHSWAHFDGGYGAVPVAFGIYSITNTDLEYWVKQSIDGYNENGIIQMLWLWHQWGVNDGEEYDHWSIYFWWYTVRTPSQEKIMSMGATTFDPSSFAFNETKEEWTITFNEVFTLEFSEWVQQSKGKSGKGQWVKVDEGIAWEGPLTFTVTVDKVSDPF